MGAAPETCISAPAVTVDADMPARPAHRRRAVAVAVSAMELLRPSSDLARLAESFADVDVLVAAEDRPANGPTEVAQLHAAAGGAVVGDAWADDGDDWDDDGGDERDEVVEGVAKLGLPHLQLHRLGLPHLQGPGVEQDLVAALSELVGFDPEPGVYALAPSSWPADPSRAVVIAAAQRIARVYGIPLLSYRCMELSVV